MNTLNSYKIDLKGMKPDTMVFGFHLDDAFFQAVNGPEIEKGDVKVNLEIRKKTGTFEFLFEMEGQIQITCDRCLDYMSLPISAEHVVKVRLGDEYDDDGEWVTVPEEDDTFDISWLLYELIALEIPLQHMHAPGECNESMISVLEAHRAVDGAGADEGIETEGESEDRPIDPRWNELKKILDNN